MPWSDKKIRRDALVRFVLCEEQINGGKKKRYNEKMRALGRKKDFLAFNKMPIQPRKRDITFCNIVIIF